MDLESRAKRSPWGQAEGPHGQFSGAFRAQHGVQGPRGQPQYASSCLPLLPHSLQSHMPVPSHTGHLPSSLAAWGPGATVSTEPYAIHLPSSPQGGDSLPSAGRGARQEDFSGSCSATTQLAYSGASLLVTLVHSQT